MKRTTKLIITSIPLFFSVSSLAAVTAVNGIGTRSSALQAFTGVADDPSAIYYNAGGISQIHKKEVQIDASINMPRLSYTNSNNNVTARATKISFGGDAFIVVPMKNHFTFGFGLYSPFARDAQYPVTAATSSLPERSRIMRVDMVPTLAYAFNHYVSLGVSFVYSWIYNSSSIFATSERAQGDGATGQAGLLIHLSKKLRLGITYRGEENARMSGEGNDNGFAIGTNRTYYSSTLPFPAVAVVGLSYQANQNWLFAGSVGEEFWSDFQENKRNYANGAVVTNAVDGYDAYNFRLGTEYRPHHSNNAYRLGLAYLTPGTPTRNLTPSKPDFTIYSVSLGYSRYFKNVRLDVSYMYELSPKRTAGSNNALFPGTYQAHNSFIMAGAVFKI